MAGPGGPPKDLRATLVAINGGVALHSPADSAQTAALPSLPPSAKATLLDAQIEAHQTQLLATLRQHADDIIARTDLADALPRRVDELRARIARLRAAPSLSHRDVHDVGIPLPFFFFFFPDR